MSRRPIRSVLVVVLLGSTTSGCGDAADVPDRPADVTGVVAEAGDPGGPVLADPSDGYFAGMSLLRGDPVLTSSDGETVPSSALQDGDEVEVWVDGPCAESFPVQCTVTALRVRE